jgi:hypothetical protein
MEGPGVDAFQTVRDAGRTIEVAKTCDDQFRLFALVLAD